MLIGGYYYDFETKTTTYYNNAEIFDPKTGKWTETEQMKYSRGFGHSAALLEDGKVLVSGGYNDKGKYLSKCELYLPELNTWIQTDTLITPRVWHSQIITDNGDILLIGGKSYDNITGSTISENSCLLFNKQNYNWEIKNELEDYRTSADIFNIGDNKFIIVGGDYQNTWAIYDADDYNIVYSEVFSAQVFIDQSNVIDIGNKTIFLIGGHSWEYNDDIMFINQSKRCWSLEQINDILNEKPLITNQYQLYQNYPNPFNPTTIIKYSIPVSPLLRGVSEGRGVFVTLKIYNILGQEVASLVNEQQSAGNYELKFDATQLSSGVYFYKLQAGAYKKTMKMILIK